MPSPLRPDQRQFPLHVHISVMFTFLLLLTGVVLSLFHYRQTTQIILSSSEKLFSRIEQDVRLDLHATYEPIRHLLSLLMHNPAAQAPDLQQRLQIRRAQRAHHEKVTGVVPQVQRRQVGIVLERLAEGLEQRQALLQVGGLGCGVVHQQA